jgi:murein DD-endopeptidase MepM/ murein hydrolase activator NlpD
MRHTFAKPALTLILLLATASIAYGVDPVTHKMEKGETLYSISRMYKISYEALAAANGITDPTRLRIGTLITIPSVHVVIKGDTLYSISRAYGVSIDDLLSANKLNSGYVLKVGDTLIVPGGNATEQKGAGPEDQVKPQPNASSPATPVPVAAAPATPATATTVPPAIVSAPAPGSANLPSVAAPAPAAAVVPGAAPTAIPATGTATTVPSAAPVAKSSQPAVAVPMPEPVKTQDKPVDKSLLWPALGNAMYLDGKLEGIMIRVKSGETSKAVAGGVVVSAGPSRGFNQVAFIQAKSGYVYVYGGNESLSVKTGDQIVSGKEIGKIGMDAKDGSPVAYFFVFRNGQPIDPALAPRD